MLYGRKRFEKWVADKDLPIARVDEALADKLRNKLAKYTQNRADRTHCRITTQDGWSLPEQFIPLKSVIVFSYDIDFKYMYHVRNITSLPNVLREYMDMSITASVYITNSNGTFLVEWDKYNYLIAYLDAMPWLTDYAQANQLKLKQHIETSETPKSQAEYHQEMIKQLKELDIVIKIFSEGEVGECFICALKTIYHPSFGNMPTGMTFLVYYDHGWIIEDPLFVLSKRDINEQYIPFFILQFITLANQTKAFGHIGYLMGYITENNIAYHFRKNGNYLFGSKHFYDFEKQKYDKEIWVDVKEASLKVHIKQQPNDVSETVSRFEDILNLLKEN